MAAKNSYQVSKELAPLSAKPNGTNTDMPWPASGTPIVADVQPPGFSPVTEEALAVIVQRLVPALQPDKIIVFGSYIYGTPSPDSDLDLLVIFETRARPVDRYVKVSSLLRPRPFPLDILVKTPEEIEQAFAQGDPFIVEILTQGRVLYE
jgi:predicted nucleotidyltransferase